MSLPPGFLDELRSRVPISQVIGKAVTWDARKSNQGKGDYWAPCPFHQEKTASFHVDDRKGFYYCFGCHAKGDALTFLRENQNMSFMEAVEAMAREAGMTMPARDPAAAQKAERRTTLSDVMDKAVRFYKTQLMGGQASDARAYLERRGLSAQQLERWEIGYAPDQRQALWSHLTGAGIDGALIIEAGLCAKPDDGGQPYDRFRGRIMFPIRDTRDRCIAFGGRAMAENARAKYLNSPETPLFDKGKTLFNIGPARSATGKDHPLIVAEGYMDVIALEAAGFAGAVAPLGTAVTEDQLRLMWRMTPEPIIALDGDKAGLRAGHRLADLALPLIASGQSLRFVLLPGGQDPDDLIKVSGAGAMQALLDNALPMAQLLWRREIDGLTFDSPERRAALSERLKRLSGRITDPELREQYGREFNNLKFALFRELSNADWRKGAGGKGRSPANSKPLPITRGSLLAAGSEDIGEELREALVLAVLCAHPELLEQFENDLLALDPLRADHRELQSMLLTAVQEDPVPDAAILTARGGVLLEDLRRRGPVAIAPVLRAQARIDDARQCLSEEFALLRTRRAMRRETDEAAADLDHLADEGLTWRLNQAAQAADRARRGVQEDTKETHVAANGAQLDKEELEHARQLFGSIDYSRGGRKSGR